MISRGPRAPHSLLRDGGAEQQAEDYGHEGVVEQDERFRLIRRRVLSGGQLTSWPLCESCGGLVGLGHAKNWLLGCGGAFARVDVDSARWKSVNRLAKTLRASGL